MKHLIAALRATPEGLLFDTRVHQRAIVLRHGACLRRIAAVVRSRPAAAPVGSR